MSLPVSPFWFVGPFIAFGGLKPLAGAGLRILVLVLLLSGLLLWLADLSLSTVLVALLCLLIWCAAPLLSFGNAEPFRAEYARVIAISVLLLVFAVYWLYRLWRRMRTDEQFLTRCCNWVGSKRKRLRTNRSKRSVQRLIMPSSV